QFDQAQEFLKLQPGAIQPKLVLNVPDRSNFFDIKPDDFELQNYDPLKPQLHFDLAI
ncbi:thymidylate synthase, partial [Streptococcus pyogenes]